MIGFLQGKIIDKTLHSLTLLVGGVGYEVLTTNKVLEKEIDTSINLFCYTHVREDQLTIFGFRDKQEKDLFIKLIGVSGVGPKSALAVISTLGVDDCLFAIKDADITMLTTVSGLGKKGAQKIVVELQSKIGEVKELDLKGESNSNDKDVVDALTNLGFRKENVIITLREIDKNLSIEERIKMALVKLGGQR